MEQNISFPLLQASQPMQQPCHQPEERLGNYKHEDVQVH